MAGMFMLTFFSVSAATIPQTQCVTLTNSLGYKYGDARTNGEVTKLQTYLFLNKYLTVSPTGYYGNLTRTAVLNFQRDNGINQTGFAGSLTRAKLFQVSCPPQESISQKGITLTVATTSIISGSTSTTVTTVTHTRTITVSNPVIVPLLSATNTPTTIDFLNQSIVTTPVVDNTASTTIPTGEVIVPVLSETSPPPTPTVIPPAPVVTAPVVTSPVITKPPASVAPVLPVSNPAQTNSISLTSLSAVSGTIGSRVNINGTGFGTGTSNVVYISGNRGPVAEVINATTLRFIVPTGAGGCDIAIRLCADLFIRTGTTYRISIRNQNGTSNELDFLVR